MTLKDAPLKIRGGEGNKVKALLHNTNKETDTMSKIYPTKSEYEMALDVVQRYKQRQETLKRLAKDLSFHLQNFEAIKLKVNKKEGKVVFSGMLDGQIKIGESVCSSSDIFNETIGKLVAVKKALSLDTKDVIEHVERKAFTGGISLINSHLPYALTMSRDGISITSN